MNIQIDYLWVALIGAAAGQFVRFILPRAFDFDRASSAVGEHQMQELRRRLATPGGGIITVRRDLLAALVKDADR